MIIVTLLVGLIASCGPTEPAPTPAPPAATMTSIPHTGTPAPPTATTVLPTATEVPPPTASGPPNTWVRLYEQDPPVAAHSVLLTENGGFLLVGSTNYTHNDTPREDIWLCQTDAAGEVLWQITLGGEDFDRARVMIPASDGGYVILAETRSFGAGARDIYVLKVDGAGNEVWSRAYGGPVSSGLRDALLSPYRTGPWFRPAPPLKNCSPLATPSRSGCRQQLASFIMQHPSQQINENRDQVRRDRVVFGNQQITHRAISSTVACVWAMPRAMVWPWATWTGMATRMPLWPTIVSTTWSG